LVEFIAKKSSILNGVYLKELIMSDIPKTTSHSLRVRRLWKPAVATGTGGTAVVIWFEEVVTFFIDWIGLILIPILAAFLYLFNIFLFKSYELKSDDQKK
jgi:hypothetical protein